MTATICTPKALAPDEGLRLQSGPGRDLVFKLTGEDTRGALDYLPLPGRAAWRGAVARSP